MERHYILIKGKIHQDDISILNTFTPNTRVATFVKETRLQFKSRIVPHTVIVGDSKALTKEQVVQTKTKQKNIVANRYL